MQDKVKDDTEDDEIGLDAMGKHQGEVIRDQSKLHY